MSEDKATDLLIDMVADLQKRGKAGSYTKSIVKAIRSWMKHHRKHVGEVNVAKADATPSLRNERTPTQDELARIHRAADPDARAAASLVSQTGIRLGVLGNHKGDDGLRLKDLEGVEIDNDARTVNFTVLPFFVTVREELSKSRRQYLTLGGEEAARNLKDYFEQRMRSGERLTGESPVLRPAHVRKQFIRTTNVSDKIRNAIRAAGFQWRSYVLRPYFDTQLLQAESKGLVIRDYRTFWMGHRGDVEHTYTLNKRTLPKDLLEDLRESYRRCTGLLQSEPPAGGREDEKLLFRKQLLLAVGYTEAETAAMNLQQLGDEELKQKLRDRLLGLENNGSRSTVVPRAELADYIRKGWEFAGHIDDQQSIVRLPA